MPTDELITVITQTYDMQKATRLYQLARELDCPAVALIAGAVTELPLSGDTP